MPTLDDGTLELADWLNAKARETIVRDAVHAPMYFLRLPDGRLEPRLFAVVEQRPVGEIRSREMGDAVRETGAMTVAIVSEAWVADEADVPDGQAAGDSATSRDILLVAVLDDHGGCVVYQTPVRHVTDDDVELGDSARVPPGSNVTAFADVRAAWAERAAASPVPGPTAGRRGLLGRLRGR